MFGVTVRDHVMVAHSLPRPVFGPAQGLHGATYVVEATFRRRELDDDGIVVDIGAATAALDAVLGVLRYQNLDDLPELAGLVTSTEVLARWVADRLTEHDVTTGLDGLEVVLRESPDAWVSYTRDG
jgi:6-pyruvoyltetrahydropterin/6-carboxytetrahydropterin synthase